MNKEQIETFEYCKDHVKCIETWKENLPFKTQKYGCGGSAPNIEHILEKVHREMIHRIRTAMEDARNDIERIINKI